MAEFHLVLSCTACRKIRDDRWDGVDEGTWCTVVEFLRRYHADSDNVITSECYCPDCSLSYDRLMQYGQARLDAQP